MKIIFNKLFVVIFYPGIMATNNLFAQVEKTLIPPIPFGCADPNCDNLLYTLQGDYLNDLATFKSDDGTLLTGLEFQVGENVNDYFHPLVLISGSQISISLSIEVNCVDFPSSVLIRGKKDGQIIFPEETVSVVSSVLNNISSINYLKSSTINLQPEKVDLVNLDVDWEISYGNGEWNFMGNSVNKLYVTWKNPKAENPGFSLQQSQGYEHLETVFYIGCEYAKNQSTEDEIIDGDCNYDLYEIPQFNNVNFNQSLVVKTGIQAFLTTIEHELEHCRIYAENWNSSHLIQDYVINNQNLATDRDGDFYSDDWESANTANWGFDPLDVSDKYNYQGSTPYNPWFFPQNTDGASAGSNYEEHRCRTYQHGLDVDILDSKDWSFGPPNLTKFQGKNW